ncbi:unnamed protein product [Bursaphelenchus xylophilus]|uniref:(pine wood nematode) hypothetical protein n=1 Tax=Bursaphelenchus xylophilus TaxID=6326 RepID=A0A1I7SX79_BURXY|nr:unnamed protein product [Bursaphelenchus xylophilus]CAG9100240.1 unnamed protein product [Bursaphelenchus xylophilus]
MSGRLVSVHTPLIGFLFYLIFVASTIFWSCFSCLKPNRSHRNENSVTTQSQRKIRSKANAKSCTEDGIRERRASVSKTGSGDETSATPVTSDDITKTKKKRSISKSDLEKAKKYLATVRSRKKCAAPLMDMNLHAEQIDEEIDLEPVEKIQGLEVAVSPCPMKTARSRSVTDGQSTSQNEYSRKRTKDKDAKLNQKLGEASVSKPKTGTEDSRKSVDLAEFAPAMNHLDPRNVGNSNDVGKCDPIAGSMYIL